uniref:Palmitoyltransferase n=1 Tax=Eutreptiella gymnastica TaxID=73025 RepID=A0A7S1NKB1_9EUGL|mmetsp:Transcript_4907/g.8969  ORF Transcript_4907/g.8969 Transcript_4907/m.8969 type:complete len:277 (+) Transcript_4907:172-1002(+)
MAVVAVSITLLIGTPVVYLWVLLPILCPIGGLPWCLAVVSFIWAAGNLALNYTLCVRTSPGHPTAPAQAPAAPPEVRGESGAHAVQGDQAAPARWAPTCTTCHVVKPARAHHCSICQRCVLRMDHHCAFINACVGYYNYRFFLRMLWYLSLTCLHILVALGLHEWGVRSPNATLGMLLQLEAWQTPLLLVSAVFFTAGLLFTALHTYLLLTNRTCVELAAGLGRPGGSPYDLGWRSNVLQVFGSLPWLGCVCLPMWGPLPDPEGLQSVGIDDEALV